MVVTVTVCTRMRALGALEIDEKDIVEMVGESVGVVESSVKGTDSSGDCRLVGNDVTGSDSELEGPTGSIERFVSNVGCGAADVVGVSVVPESAEPDNETDPVNPVDPESKNDDETLGIARSDELVELIVNKGLARLGSEEIVVEIPSAEEPVLANAC